MADNAVQIEEISEYKAPLWFLARWPKKAPMLFVGDLSYSPIKEGENAYCFLALGFSPVAKKKALEKKISCISQKEEKRFPFQGGLFGILSYDDYSPATNQDSKEDSKFYEVDDLLVFSMREKRLFRVKKTFSGSKYTQDLGALLKRPAYQEKAAPKLSLLPLEPASLYLEKAAKALQEIRDGRFYQINFLRYFKVKNPPCYEELLKRYQKNSGPYSLWLRERDFEIVSFSPEQFVAIKNTESGLFLRARPIKGSIKNHNDKKIADELAHKLLTSKKDLAELHMIVDLMRNDMFRVSSPNSLKVLESHRLLRFKTIMHLVATIESELKTPLLLGDFFKNLLPGGSITGVPKIEVMKAIYEYENRNRGFFMGTAFYLDQKTNSLDSNILIRTLCRKGDEWHYAAGSGLVIHSDPKAELLEIDTKCLIVTKNLL